MQLVVNEPHALRFEVNRAALVDPAIHELEQRKIFGRLLDLRRPRVRAWRPRRFQDPHDRRRPVIFCRSSENQVRVFLNTCRHRGSLVCREREGNAERYTCFYHGWTTTGDGALYAVPGQSAYRRASTRKSFP